VVINLITNASESLEDHKGDIIISTGLAYCEREDLSQSFLDDNLPEGEYVYLEVTDTGKGMDAHACAKIFDPFYTTKFVGRGLGLASVLGIVRGHKGAIQVRSELGEGTSIRILLPAIEWNEKEQRIFMEDIVQSHSKRAILLIDDDPSVRQVGAEMLKLLGFSVMTAPDGRRGIDLFSNFKESIDLVVLDLTMPELDGSETYHALRRINNEVRVILSSGYNEQEATQHLEGSGLVGYIQKPYTVAKLRKTLAQALALAS
jgi:CheY-like chemotaxis protein